MAGSCSNGTSKSNLLSISKKGLKRALFLFDILEGRPMIKISGKTIRMTKGDTLEVPINIMTKDGKPYIPSEGDVIRFAMKREYNDAEPLILKVIPNDTLILRIESDETKDLEIRKVPYVYDIELTTVTGTVDTFLAGGLYLTEEVL